MLEAWRPLIGGVVWLLGADLVAVAEVGPGVYGGIRTGYLEPNHQLSGWSQVFSGTEPNLFGSVPSAGGERTLFGGYQFNQYFSIEAAWIDAPDPLVRWSLEKDKFLPEKPWGLDPGERFDRIAFGAVGKMPVLSLFENKRVFGGGALTAEAASGGFSLGAMGSLPIATKFGLFGKAVFSNWDRNLSQSGSEPFEDLGSRSLLFGLGARYDLSEMFSVKTEWQRLNDVTDLEIDFLSVGVSARF